MKKEPFVCCQEVYPDQRKALLQQMKQAVTQLSDSLVPLEMKARALESGEGLIRSDATGLEPELQLVFHKILGYTQVWANSQGKEFLYGLG